MVPQPAETPGANEPVKTVRHHWNTLHMIISVGFYFIFMFLFSQEPVKNEGEDNVQLYDCFF